MHDWRQPLQPPLQPKLDPGDRLILHSLGVRWDEPEQIEAPRKKVNLNLDGVERHAPSEYPDYE